MSGSIADTAALMKQEADDFADLVASVEELAGLLYTAPDANRDFWQSEMQGHRQLRIELLRYARLCERAERALAKGLKRKRWRVQA
ncbi:MAG: hypothetical protein LCH70_07605 [Proteobacteria bacterium]|nr:hypothetical protein [Pseudomonadota bacterium]